MDVIVSRPTDGSCYMTVGSRLVSDVDAESGIETSDSDSATASVTSSEYAAAAAAMPTASHRRDNPTAVSSSVAPSPDMAPCSEEVGEFIRRMMVQPPPSSIVVDDRDIRVVPRPTDVTLPPLDELPEDDATVLVDLPSPGYADYTQCAGSWPRTVQPSSMVGEFTEMRTGNVMLDACDDLTAVVHHEQDAVDENYNRVQILSDGKVAAAAVNRSCPPVAAKRFVKPTTVYSGNHGVSADVPPVSVSTTTNAALPVTAVPPVTKSATLPRSFSIPNLPASHRHFSGDTETYVTESRKRTSIANIWKRFMKRDYESGGMTSSTGFTWTLLPHHRRSMTLQSASIADTTATLRRRSKDPPQSKAATLAAAAADGGSKLQISLPSNFRVLGTNDEFTHSGEEQLASTGLRDVKLVDVQSSRNEGDNNADADDDEATTATAAKGSLDPRPATSTFRDERGRLSHATIDPRIVSASSTACLSGRGGDDTQRSSPKNERRFETATLDRPRDPPPTSGGVWTALTTIATLPRLHKRGQSSTEDPPSQQRWSDPPSTAFPVDADDDDLDDVRRCEYLQTSAANRVRPSLSIDTEKLLRRSMTSEDRTSSPTPLLDFVDWISTLEEEEAATSVNFDTFRGALEPMRWLEDHPSSKISARVQRSRSFSSTTISAQQTAASVQLPSAYLAVISDPAFPPVAAPRSINARITKRPRPDRRREVNVSRILQNTCSCYTIINTSFAVCCIT